MAALVAEAGRVAAAAAAVAMAATVALVAVAGQAVAGVMVGRAGYSLATAVPGGRVAVPAR